MRKEWEAEFNKKWDADVVTYGDLKWDLIYASTDWFRSWKSQLLMDSIFSRREYYGLCIWDPKNPDFMKDPLHRIVLPVNDNQTVAVHSQDKHDYMGRRFVKPECQSSVQKKKLFHTPKPRIDSGLNPF